jgi:hypothetical protein
MAYEPRLIIEVPSGGAIEAQLRTDPPSSIAGDDVVITIGATDAEGNLEPPFGGEAVLAVPSPEALAREADQVRRVIREAGTGDEPLVLEIEAAEELREDELAAVVDSLAHTSRPVILRIIRNV